MSAPDSHQASPRPTVIEKHRCGVYSSPIDLWPDDWAASLRTAGRTFRLPLQMIDNRASARSGAQRHLDLTRAVDRVSRHPPKGHARRDGAHPAGLAPLRAKQGIEEQPG